MDMVLLLWNIYRKLLRNTDVLIVIQLVLGVGNKNVVSSDKHFGMSLSDKNREIEKLLQVTTLSVTVFVWEDKAFGKVW